MYDTTTRPVEPGMEVLDIATGPGTWRFGQRSRAPG
jgi:ubiquinone/menaquinone biosynthesis C-methylase UbiE